MDPNGSETSSTIDSVESRRNGFLSGDEIYSVIDIDSFEAMVWAKENPEKLNGKPTLIVNNKGITIAVSYEAKAFGVSRKDNKRTAKEKCPSLVIFEIPAKDGKPDQTIPIMASHSIHKCVREFLRHNYPEVIMAMKSKDEMYLEMSECVDKILKEKPEIEVNFYPHKQKTVILGGWGGMQNARRLGIASMITEEILRKIQQDTGFVASAGIAASCILAKIACGNDKPNGLTIITNNGLQPLYENTRIQDAPGLKGNHGDAILEIWKKPDGTDLKTLMDFRNYVDIEDVRNQLRLNNYQTNQLRITSTGVDLKSLEDEQKKTLSSSWIILGSDISSDKEALQKYVLNCCEDLGLKINYEKELFERTPKRLKFQLKSEQRKRKANGKKAVIVVDTTPIEFPKDDFPVIGLGEFLWNELYSKWNGIEATFSDFECVTEVELTAVY